MNMARNRARGSIAAIGIVVLSVCAHAQTPPTSRDLSELSIEDLLKITVTSVSKKDETLLDAPAAIFVVSNDDIRRSGATSVAEALRLVPGLDVAAVNSREWAISARGFNGIVSNKLLVLVDGRSVYAPLFAGVYWDQQEPMLIDVDRIEVIRGPGATLWGANAVNGVINIITRSAKDTQGTEIELAAGNVLQPMGSARSGGKLGESTYYRVFGNYASRDDYPLTNGQSAKDAWQEWHGGFRLDSYPDTTTHVTWQGNATRVRHDEHASTGYNLNTLGRWTRQLSERSNIELQTYFDRTNRHDSTRALNIADTVDVTLQHTFGVGRNDINWGLGYRFVENHLTPLGAIFSLRNGEFGVHLFTAFVQNEFKLVPDALTVTAGVKLERHDAIGVELQPSLRAMFKPTKQQRVWAAVSRAVRTPDEFENKDALAITAGAPFVGPGGSLYLPTWVGNGNPSSEVVWAHELGYRLQPASRVSVDLATFYNRYSDLITPGDVARFLPGTPVGIAEIPFTNLLNARAYGGEAAVTASPMDSWRLTAGYSLAWLKIGGPVHALKETQQVPPKHQISVKSSNDITKRASVNAQLRYVDKITSVPAYVTADVVLSYRLTDRFEFSLVGQNLFSDQHPEQGFQFIATTSEIPRSFYAKLSWRPQ